MPYDDTWPHDDRLPLRLADNEHVTDPDVVVSGEEYGQWAGQVAADLAAWFPGRDLRLADLETGVTTIIDTATGVGLLRDTGFFLSRLGHYEFRAPSEHPRSGSALLAAVIDLAENHRASPALWGREEWDVPTWIAGALVLKGWECSIAYGTADQPASSLATLRFHYRGDSLMNGWKIEWCDPHAAPSLHVFVQGIDYEADVGIDADRWAAAGHRPEDMSWSANPHTAREAALAVLEMKHSLWPDAPTPPHPPAPSPVSVLAPVGHEDAPSALAELLDDVLAARPDLTGTLFTNSNGSAQARVRTHDGATCLMRMFKEQPHYDYDYDSDYENDDTWKFVGEGRQATSCGWPQDTSAEVLRAAALAVIDATVLRTPLPSPIRWGEEAPTELTELADILDTAGAYITGFQGRTRLRGKHGRRQGQPLPGRIYESFSVELPDHEELNVRLDGTKQWWLVEDRSRYGDKDTVLNLGFLLTGTRSNKNCMPADKVTLRRLAEVIADQIDVDLPEATPEPVALVEGRPEPRLIRTPRDAELVAAEWMRWFGFDDAAATPVGPDAGVDVESADAVAQVKTETVPVGRPAVQRLAGVAAAAGKTGLFFSLSGYIPGAVTWADQAGIALFEFDLQGEPVAVNESARALTG